MVILAIVHSAGVYEGNPYDNVLFHCFTEQDELPKGLLAGQPVETVKLKTSVVKDCLGELNSVNWQNVVGGEILPVYNKFGQVKNFSLSYDNSDAGNVDKADVVNIPAVSDKSPEDSEIVNRKSSKK